MFMLEAKKSIVALSAAAAVFLTGCTLVDTPSSSNAIEKNIDGAVIYPVKNGKYGPYNVNTQDTSGFDYGRTPTKNEIAAWDKDVMPDGTGLPEGEGSVEDGDELYHSKCAMCHGDFGVGGKGYPTLVGGKGTLKNQLLKEGDEPPLRTIGSYWPYASTLFWYIQSAMPFPHPKSLSNDETYAITAYLLFENGIKANGEPIDDEFVLSKDNFMDIQMPNKDGFYPVSPDRNDLKEQRGPLSQGERCMTNCDVPGIVEIKREITGFEPPLSTKRDLPEEKGDSVVSFGEKMYNETCSACHANDALGAPVVGNSEDWAEVTEKGMDTVYKNAINGINAMPPRGGSDLSDEELKQVIDYMVSVSK